MHFSLVAQMVKNLPAMQETWFDLWVGKMPWRRAYQLTLVLLAGESPWTEEPGRLQSTGVAKGWTQLSDQAQHISHFTATDKKTCLNFQYFPH